jgi:hypothetical protein
VRILPRIKRRPIAGKVYDTGKVGQADHLDLIVRVTGGAEGRKPARIVVRNDHRRLRHGGKLRHHAVEYAVLGQTSVSDRHVDIAEQATPVDKAYPEGPATALLVLLVLLFILSFP